MVEFGNPLPPALVRFAAQGRKGRGSKVTAPLPLREGLGEGSDESRLLHHARAMRGQPTPAERKLWHALRNWQLDNLKVRRQVAIGRYVADFYCPPARLVIEVDGESHVDPSTDLIRDKWMRAQGLRVLHVWNDEVMTNLDGVLLLICDAAKAAPLPPAPSRKGRGSKIKAPLPLREGLGEGS